MSFLGLVKNTAFGFIGVGMNVVVGTTVSIMVARHLGPFEMGLLSLLQWTRSSVAMIVDMGITSAITKFVSELEGQGDRATANGLSLRMIGILQALALLFGIGVFTFAPATARLLGERQLVPFLPIVGILVVLTLLNTGLRGYITGHQRFAGRSLVDTISAFVSLTGVLYILIHSGGVAGLLKMEVLVGVVQLSAYVLLLVKHWTLTPVSGVSRQLGGRVLWFCAGMFSITFLNAVVFQRSETIFLSHYSSAAQIAYYGLAYNIAFIVVIVPAATLGSVLLPAMSNWFGANQQETLSLAYVQTTRYAALLVFPVCAIGAAIAPQLIVFLYGQEFVQAGVSLRTLLFGGALMGVAAPGSSLFFTLGKPHMAITWLIPAALLDLALAYLLVPSFGAHGAALANTAGQFVGAISVTAYVTRTGRFHLPSRNIMRIAVASLPAGLMAYSLITNLEGAIGLLLSLIAGTIVYALLLPAMSVLTPSDLDMLVGLVRGLPQPVADLLLRVIERMRYLMMRGAEV